MAATTVYVTSITSGVGDFTAAAGGPIRLEFQHEGTPFMDRTGDDEYSPFVCITDKRLIVRIRLREVKAVIAALGTKGQIVAILTGGSNPGGGGARNSTTLTFPDMVFVGASPGEQGRAEGGSVTLVFEHESSDGSTVPIS